MGDGLNLKCFRCGRKMQMVMDTPLCPVCNADVIFELNSYVKADLKNMKKGELNDKK